MSNFYWNWEICSLTTGLENEVMKKSEDKTIVDFFLNYKDSNNSFQHVMEKHADEELISIITNPEDYQQDALIAAVKVSIDRKILTNEQGIELIKMIHDKIEKDTGIANEEREKEKKKYSEMLPLGVIILICGIMFSVASVANPINGNSYVFYGAIIIGIGMIIRGA